MHASLTDTTALPATMRRYDWPSPHHPVTSAADAAATFAANRPGGPCNGGVAIPLNPTTYNPFLRTLVLELARALGSTAVPDAPALPPTRLFALVPAPAASPHFNPLAGHALEVPRVDRDQELVGGVRFPAVVVPLGSPVPVSVPPVITSSITGICGNVGGWRPFTAAAIVRRYGSEAAFRREYEQALASLVRQGFLLSSEQSAMLARASAHYEASATRP